MANFIDWLIGIFGSSSQPSVIGAINWDETINIITPHIKKPSQIYLSDATYSLTSVDELRKFLNADRTNYGKYEAEGHDCDNFSYQLMGYFSKWSYSFCFGIAWSKGHAFNIMIDSNKKLYVIEPQGDAIFTIEEVIKASNLKPLYYPFEMVII